MLENGIKYNHWTIIDNSTAGKDNSYSHKCECVCGNIRFVPQRYLKTGASKSCGCLGVYVGYETDKFILVEILAKDKRGRVGKWRCKKCLKDHASRIVNAAPRFKYCLSCEKKEARQTTLIHGESPQKIRTKEYNIWRGLRQRCNSPSNASYPDYGGRGIKVCDRWASYKNFIADMGRCPDKYSIDRINSDGDYTPENCRWADAYTQSNNRRGIVFLLDKGEKISLADFCRRYDLRRNLVRYYVSKGWDADKIKEHIKEKARQRKRG